jgi:hypothetical protein
MLRMIADIIIGRRLQSAGGGRRTELALAASPELVQRVVGDLGGHGRRVALCSAQRPMNRS